MAAFISRKKFVGKMISSQLVLSLLSIMLSFSTGTISKVIPGLSYITAFLAGLLPAAWSREVAEFKATVPMAIFFRNSRLFCI